MIRTKELIAAFIDSKQGWAVREQFEDTFEETSEENFDEQNRNALALIEEVCSRLLKSEILCEDSQNDLEEYVYALRLHLERR